MPKRTIIAYKNRVEFVEKGKIMWKGVTPSGVAVRVQVIQLWETSRI